MSALARVTEVVGRFDDQGWIALANRGLLRRATKDLDATDVDLVADDADAVTVAVGDRQVRIPVSGPAEATCSCPSAVTCQHVLTACLWLARGTAAADAPDPAAADRLHEEVMAHDPAELRAAAGLAGLRWAHQLLADLDALGEVVEVERGDYLTVRLPRPEVTLRYFGGGLDAWVLDESVKDPRRVRVAAVLAWQRAHGTEQPAPPPPRRSRASTQLGETRTDSRARLRAAVAGLLADTVRTGVSHLSEAVLERYTTLAVWAQGAEYHRLALHLRRLADQVELLLDRSARADDRRLLDDVVLAHGLVRALDDAARSGLEPPRLVGRARTKYDKVATLPLVGLGGAPWRSGSGYHGLTMLFWAPDKARFMTWTDARPETVMGFEPRARWHQPGPWTAMASPSASVGRRVTLNQAQVSSESRISGVESTSARVSTIINDELLAALPVVETWAELFQRDRSRSLLDPPTADDRWAVVRPASFGDPRFDPNRQVLLWPLWDVQGELLLVELPWADLHAHATARIESLGAVPEGSALVLRLRPGSSGPVGEPVSLVLPGHADLDEAATGPVDALHFHPGPATTGSRWVEAMRDRPGEPPERDEVARPTLRQLATLRSWLEQHAERGTSGTHVPAMVTALAGHHRALRDVGLHCFPAIDPAVEHDPADLLLRSHYLLQQVEQVSL